MADTKISAITTDSAPDRVADYAPTYDASAVATKKVLLSDFGAIPYVTWFGNALSPADSTTYVFSPFPAFGLATTVASHRTYIQRAGKIVAVRLFGGCTTGSAENSTVALRLNDTTDTTITSTLALNASPFTVANTAISIAVAVGDYITIKITTPAWVTNPTNVTTAAQIYQT